VRRVVSPVPPVPSRALSRSLSPRGLVVVLAVTVTVGLGVAGCGSNEATPAKVVLVTHDSFAVSKEVKAAFEQESGLELQILQSGDAGAVLNTALLTAGDPQGDVLFGVDNTLLSRALEGDLLEPYESPSLDRVPPEYTPSDSRVTPIDHGEVCLNVDRSWFTRSRVPLPTSLADLLLARYRGLLVVENPATSSPGLAFLLATVATFGDEKWQDYWRGLRANGVRVVDGWEEAYTQEFSGAAGSPGKRPIVVSYATSPAAEVIFATKKLATAPTAAIDAGCFRQTEYAGILRGAANEPGARAFIDFMLSQRFQADVPTSMFVMPVRTGVPIPNAFVEHALVPSDPLTLPPDEIAANRDAWVDTWTDIVLR
jgi:thiamine transport system substrate-binding protein